MMNEIPEHPRSRKRRIYILSIIVLLDVLIVFSLLFFYPLLTMLASQSWTSFNWSGYAVASDLNNPRPLVTSIYGSWTVPTVTGLAPGGEAYSAVWIGIGGQFLSDQSLIQAGTEQDSSRGRAEYSAWYELLPDNPVVVDSLTISTGDKITTIISLSNSEMNSWLVEIRDITNGQSFQRNFTYDSSKLSAEWIVEAPTVNNRLMLANFSEVTFTSCTATIGSRVGSIADFPHADITMNSRQDTQLVTVSPLYANGTSFTLNDVT